MECPICSEYGKTYASKPMGNVKQRYRQCEGCGWKFRTYEEIDRAPVAQANKPTRRVPLVDPANITCPDCQGPTQHVRRAEGKKKITRYFRCKAKPCGSKFAIETDLSDPIGKARDKAEQEAQKARPICPKCNGKTFATAMQHTKTRSYRRLECEDCAHRFNVTVSDKTAPGDPPIVREGEIEHRVMP